MRIFIAEAIDLEDNTNYSITSNVQDNLCVQTIVTHVFCHVFLEKIRVFCPKENRVPSLGFNIEDLVYNNLIVTVIKIP